MKKAFSLIELLIVVVVLGILVGAFGMKLSQADTLSDVATARSNMVVLSQALEAYKLDYGAVPNCNSFGNPHAPPFDGAQYRVLERLSTPISYIADPGAGNPFIPDFRRNAANAYLLTTSMNIVVGSGEYLHDTLFYYQSWNDTQRSLIPSGSSGGDTASQYWLLQSSGPDLMYFNLGGPLANDRDTSATMNLFYDPSNGIVSFGSLFDFGGGSPAGSPGYAAGTGLYQAFLVGPGPAAVRHWEYYQ